MNSAIGILMSLVIWAVIAIIVYIAITPQFIGLTMFLVVANAVWDLVAFWGHITIRLIRE